MSQTHVSQVESKAELDALVRDSGLPAEWNNLTRQIIGAAMEVHTTLRPGLPEKLYEEALIHELQLRGLRVNRQFPVRLRYKDLLLSPVVADVVVEDLVIVENKACDEVHDAHLAQLVGYLRAANLPLGLLFNFHARRLKDGLYRRINPDALHRFPVQQGSRLDPDSRS